MEKEVLLNIGSIVDAENTRCDIQRFLIIGKRVVSHSRKAWDYYSVPYPEGTEESLNNGFYFNHPEIRSIIYRCETEPIEHESD